MKGHLLIDIAISHLSLRLLAGRLTGHVLFEACSFEHYLEDSVYTKGIKLFEKKILW